MSIRRLATDLLVLTILLLLYPAPLSAQINTRNETSLDKSYQAQANLFLFQRGLDFEAEVFQYESFLIWLYEGITSEAKKRRREDLNGTRDAFAPLDPATFDDSSYVFPSDLAEAPPRIKYQTWEKLQREKYVQKYTQARQIKDRLLSSATDEQRRRMFNTDLKSALESYRNSNYHQAILRFTELKERYGYEDLADIVFLRGESFFKVTMYDRAGEDYDYVLKHSDDVELKRRTLERLIAIAGNNGDLRGLRNSWMRYSELTGGQADESYWHTAELTARFLMSLQEWAEAQELLDQIRPKTELYIVAKLRAADCALGMLDLVDAEHRYMEIAEGKLKGKGLTKEIKWEAMLKLGYIDYLSGRYYDAYDKLSMTKFKGEMAEKASLIAAWSLFRVHDYGAVIELCNEFLEEFPKSQYFYEVFCLLGYSQEVIGRGEDAKSEYEKVMTAVDERREFKEADFEKHNVSSAIGELQRLEPDLFLEGRRELFDRYNRLRIKLKSIFERLKLAEGVMSSPVIMEMLDEQNELYRLFDELKGIEKELFATQDARLLSKYDKLYAKLLDLANDLKSGFRYQMQQKSLVHREQEQLFQARFVDSLKIRFDQEWKASEDALEKVRTLISEAESVGDEALLVDLGEIELGMMNLQVRLMAVSRNLNSFKQVDITSNLDHWSWFAYQRHSTAGLAFDYLYMRENRLKELDQYISRINNILAERHAVEEEIAELPDSLALASEPGDEPYYAPPIPLWQPKEYRPVTTDTTVTESDSTAGEPLPEESPGEQPENPPETVPGGGTTPETGDVGGGSEQPAGEIPGQPKPANEGVEETPAGDETPEGESSTEDDVKSDTGAADEQSAGETVKETVEESPVLEGQAQTPVELEREESAADTTGRKQPPTRNENPAGSNDN